MIYSVSSIISTLIAISATDNRFYDRFNWKSIDYEFPSNEERQTVIESGAYIPGNSIISSIEIWGDFLYFATPRLKPGVPSTLNFINLTDNNTSPLLIPFPSWEVNNNLNKTSKKPRMTSVHSIRVDQCHRLWALDSGISDELVTTKRIEDPPSLFVYNLVDKILIRKYTMKEDYYYADSKFRNIVVDVTLGNCENAFAYIADTRYGLIIYSWDTNKAHKINSNYFSFEPIWGNFKTSNGSLQQLNDGILGMTLGMPNKDGFRELFFQPLAGVLEYRVSTYFLRNKTTSKDCYRHIYLLGNRGDHMQSSANILDLDTGILFYTTVIKNGIACWNSFRGDNITPQNQGVINEFNENISFPADIKLDTNGTLWVLTNKMIDFIYGKEQTPIPYHIYTAPIRKLINNTPCLLS